MINVHDAQRISDMRATCAAPKWYVFMHFITKNRAKFGWQIKVITSDIEVWASRIKTSM